MPIERLFSDLISSPSAQGALGGAASGAMVSLLMNKKARKSLGGTALKLGGAAAVAGVGYYAYQQWQRRKASAGSSHAQPALPPTPGTTSISPAPSTPARLATPPLPPVDDPLAFKMVKTMIAAAHADGKIDDTEMARLEEAVHAAGLSPAEDAAVMAALNSPPALDEIAQWPNSPAEAAELYGAALLAVDPDTVAEKFFLRRLATALQLPGELVSELNTTATRP